MKKYTCAVLLFNTILGFLSSSSILSAEQEPETQLRVMTFNTYHGGTKRGQPLSQTAKVIQEGKADVAGLQEVGDNAEKLATSMGWTSVRFGRSAILTRHEVVELHAAGITIRLPDGQRAHIINCHLNHAPYQPYQLLEIPYANAPFIKTEAEAIAAAKSARGKEVATLLEQIESLQDKEAPVVVTGDFNEPSHLDWTAAAAKSGRHPIKVEYPSSMEFAKAGFSDSWRAAHPDEMKKPGFTWSPMTKASDPKNHHDRIDFVYFRGKGMKLNEVKLVGEDKENADITLSPYPSDHRAVVALFTLSNNQSSEKTDTNKPAAGDGK